MLLTKDKKLYVKLLLKLKKIKKIVTNIIKYKNKWISSWKKFKFFSLKKIILYTKKILKKETSINNEKITICVSLTSIDESSFTGKKPPEEIKVIAKFKELKYLILKIFKIIKIDNVITEYNKKILIVCFNISELLKDKKFVRDFFKLSS